MFSPLADGSVKSGVATSVPGTCITGPIPCGVLVGADVLGRGGDTVSAQDMAAMKSKAVTITSSFIRTSVYVVR